MQSFSIYDDFFYTAVSIVHLPQNLNELSGFLSKSFKKTFSIQHRKQKKKLICWKSASLIAVTYNNIRYE